MSEFNLSDKRNELEQKILNGEIDIRKVFNLIMEQDKEFIKKLKGKIKEETNQLWALELIDKLAGDKLTSNNQKGKVEE